MFAIARVGHVRWNFERVLMGGQARKSTCSVEDLTIAAPDMHASIARDRLRKALWSSGLCVMASIRLGRHICA